MAKKKAARKPPAKKTKKKKPVKAAVKRAVRKIAPAKGVATKRPGLRSDIDGVYVRVDVALQGRLRALANGLGKPLDEVLLQALTEFADNWEDHVRTVKALGGEDDRMQLVVKPEEP